MSFTIGEMSESDWVDVRTIYSEGLATGLASFTLTPPSWKDWDNGHLSLGRLVARTDSGDMAGWAALAKVPDT